ncbi:electron transfer flavoprotein subunit beta/FixA family protein [Halarsenatibacter silvermanii]|uniref:Electron transfer flavoprotein small subunit n=1 Tax=Halarsenatibacter silvermanii TaxID=321763 RepID=A0A1G9JX39_9FIRM|nr:electron transfer flavoprotein subunit beta/FixA family protein [Halarsenatibacter silvermanii]SDL42068.1 electron transfer flavoprotein beta subunit [Halarsenatibacter silvermanii]
MDIIVLVKEVPDMEKVKFDRERGVIDRSSASAQINPFDLNALQTAVDLKEEVGGNITAISMGPPSAEDSLKEAIARGADEGILLTDTSFAGADTWATSFILSQAVKKIGDFDLVICGEMSVDGDTAQVGPQAAEFLDIPHVAFVWDIEEIVDEGLVVCTDMWSSSYRQQVNFPGMITVTKDINTPQLPSLQDKMKAKKAEITTWGLDDFAELDIEDDDVGLSGSYTKVKNIVVPPETSRDSKIWDDDYQEGLDELIELLAEKRRL